MSDQLNTDSRWIRFECDRRTKSRVTEVWTVVAKDGNFVLGEVKWFGRWRGYAFFPNMDTAYESQCMGDIAEFIKGLNARHREQRKSNKQEVNK